MTSKVFLTVVGNEKIARDVYRMKLAGDVSAITAPGQFVNILLDGFFLRRPISVYDTNDNVATIVYKTVGSGTEHMSQLKVGTVLDVLTGLGNGFDTSKSGDRALLIGGGVGAPPMHMLAKALVREGKTPTAVLGFNTSQDVFSLDDFKALGVEAFVSTVDGSVGTRGFVTDIIKNIDGYTYFYACGPSAMLRAVYDVSLTSGQLSFEERMGCGFGACMGCSCKTKYGNKRICKDGPVLEKEEIIW